MAKVLTISVLGRTEAVDDRIVAALSTQSITAGNSSSTDYVFLCTGICTVTLPTAVDNFNKYTVKRLTATITINTTLSQTIDGSTSAQLLVDNQSVDIISNGTNWLII